MIEPAGHRVLVKVEEIEEKTQGGLYIPKTVADKETEANIFGTIIALGKTAWRAGQGGRPCRHRQVWRVCNTRP